MKSNFCIYSYVKYEKYILKQTLKLDYRHFKNNYKSNWTKYILFVKSPWQNLTEHDYSGRN